MTVIYSWIYCYRPLWEGYTVIDRYGEDKGKRKVIRNEEIFCDGTIWLQKGRIRNGNRCGMGIQYGNNCGMGICNIPEVNDYVPHNGDDDGTTA